MDYLYEVILSIMDLTTARFIAAPPLPVYNKDKSGAARQLNQRSIP
jgi:hypothetical protein